MSSTPLPSIPNRIKHKILIVDNLSLMREGLHALLNDILHFTIISGAENEQDALQLCRIHHPALVLINLSHSSLDGTKTIRSIHRQFPDTKILALSTTATALSTTEVLNAGALGHILKRSNKQELLHAIDTLLDHTLYLDPMFNQQKIMTLIRQSKKTKRPILTDRETQILKLITQGNRNRDIASILNISLKTVETHRLNLMHKLEAHNAAQLIASAYRLGLLTI